MRERRIILRHDLLPKSSLQGWAKSSNLYNSYKLRMETHKYDHKSHANAINLDPLLLASSSPFLNLRFMVIDRELRNLVNSLGSNLLIRIL